MDGAGEEKPFDLSDDVALGLDPDSSRSHPSSSRGVSRFQPKLKGKLKAEPVDAPLPPRIPIKEEATLEDPAPSPAPAASSASVPTFNGILDEDPINLMDIDDGEDRVIKEIDVFLNPSLDDHTKLYVMQYPLRPSWRPYELSERLKELRINPKQSKFEVDLELDAGENYDEDTADASSERKVTLSSSEAPFTTQYAVGVLVGDKLYLNPLDGVVQFRPSMAHVDGGGLQKQKKIVQEKVASDDSHSNVENAEAWVSLDYHAKGSSFSGAYQQKMVAEAHDPIQFLLSPSDYVNSLCPLASSDSKKTKGLSKRNLLSMPLEERLKRWLCEGPQVNRFNAIMHLTPNESTNEVLKVIQRYADLVQGLWITKSSFLFKEEQAHVRDYFLFLLSKNHVVPSSKITGTKFGEFSNLKEILSQLAVKGPTNDWKLKDAPDRSFIERFPNIVKEQERSWSSREVHFSDLSAPIGKDKDLMTKSSLDSSGGVSFGGATRSNDVSTSTRTSALSNETREFLPKVIQQILRNQKVSSPKAIIQGLRELAKILRARPKDDRRYVAVADAAVYAAKASFSELQVVLSQVAINIHGVYVLKSLGNPLIDPLRDVVIELFCHKEPQAKLKKQEVQQAAQIRLKRDITEQEYSQVMKDLCDSKNGGVWVLKNGDRNPN